VIIDTEDNRELPAEELTDRLNHETRMHKKWKNECLQIHEQIDIAYQTERTALGKSVLKQLKEGIE
jgi:hypothetical protein